MTDSDFDEIQNQLYFSNEQLCLALFLRQARRKNLKTDLSDFELSAFHRFQDIAIQNYANFQHFLLTLLPYENLYSYRSQPKTFIATNELQS